MKYHCDACNMEVKPLVCAKCNCELSQKTIEKNGQKIQVAECSKCQGKVKSPQCCGKDMKCC